MSPIVRERAESAHSPIPLDRIELIDRLVPIRDLAVAIGAAAEALSDRRMMWAFAEMADRIEKDLNELIEAYE